MVSIDFLLSFCSSFGLKQQCHSSTKRLLLFTMSDIEIGKTEIYTISNIHLVSTYFEILSVILGATRSSALGEGRLLKNPPAPPLLPDDPFLDWL